jgi:hypothetical protein
MSGESIWQNGHVVKRQPLENRHAFHQRLLNQAGTPSAGRIHPVDLRRARHPSRSFLMISWIASISGKEMAPIAHKFSHPLQPTTQLNGRSTLAILFFSSHV